MPQLEDYARKRDFGLTAEPRGRRSQRSATWRFVVQWHKARRDHFDFRLELDGVLKSWAVTRGPSAKPGTKRLAVRTEDHPLAYADFEGVIPPGAYGAGPVMIWDEGRWHCEGRNPIEALSAGMLKFSLAGKRMQGRWALIRLRPEGARENWLLLKDRDAHAETDDSLATRFSSSVRSHRSFDDIRRRRKPKRGASRPVQVPIFRPPMLCRAAIAPPTGDGWIYEMKYDGYRLQVATGGDAVAIRTRNGHDWTAKFPGIATAALQLEAKSAILDGEAVILDAHGVSNFATLVQALDTNDSQAIVFMGFDLLELNGRDQRRKPLSERKRALARFLAKAPPDGAIRLAPSLSSDPQALLAAIVKAGGEGLIAKKSSSLYVGGRSPAWLKIKAKHRENAVIVGWYPSVRGRQLASLAIALPVGRRLRYAGRVGTGFDAAEETDLIARLNAASSSVPPKLDRGDLVPAGIRWVAPKLMAAVAYSGETAEGMLRGARYLGLNGPGRRPARAAKVQTRRPIGKLGNDEPVAEPVPGEPVALTHADRVVFPAIGMTKGDIGSYYALVADRIMPHLEGRPVSVVRAPKSIEDELFFQRHPMPAMKSGILRVPSPDERHQSYMAIASKAGLRTVVQFGAIELHGWGAALPDLDRPDRLVIDLDPAEDVPFPAVIQAALLIRKVLQSTSLRSFALATGGKGIHVVAPLDRSQPWDAVERVASGIARHLSRAEPMRFIANASKAHRKGRIYIDWLRNKRSATAIVPYSLRAKASATIARPVAWTALARLQSAADYSAPRFVVPSANPWAAFFSTRQSIPDSAIEFFGRGQ